MRYEERGGKIGIEKKINWKIEQQRPEFVTKIIKITLALEYERYINCYYVSRSHLLDSLRIV